MGALHVHVDWGVEYIKALYGNRDQCNVAAWPMESDEVVRRVCDICRQTGRTPMFIRMKERSGTDLAFLKRNFWGLVPMQLDCDAGAWEIWCRPVRRWRRYSHGGYGAAPGTAHYPRSRYFRSAQKILGTSRQLIFFPWSKRRG